MEDEISATKSPFEEFLLAEYSNIASAHFESQKQLALFFRYYKLFFSVPFLLLSLFEKTSKIELVSYTMFNYILICLSIIGVFFYWFAISIKYEAILYARTVNGIRNYFYNILGNPKLEEKIRVLPNNINVPAYRSLFNPIMIIILLMNTAYLSLPLYNLHYLPNWLGFLSLILFVLAHLLLNRYVTAKQESTYINIKKPSNNL